MHFIEIMNLIKKEYYDFGSFKLPIPRGDFITENILYDHYIDILHNALFPDDFSVGYMEGPYETSYFKLKRGDIVIDVGANIGLFSAVACGKGCKVIAFEPDPRPSEYLEKIKVINPSFDLTIENKALSDKKGYFNLRLSNSNGSSTMDEYMIEKCIPYKSLSNQNLEVSVMTLDQYVEDNKLISVDFIKADIEGSEMSLLRGAIETIRKFNPKLSICTYHKPSDAEDIKNLLLNINPKYIINEEYGKLYAQVI